jgi:hypothetical protein
VECFAHELASLIERCDPTMSEQLRLNLFKEKLRPELQSAVLRGEPETWQEAVKIAQKEEEVSTFVRSLIEGGGSAAHHLTDNNKHTNLDTRH